MAHARSSNEAGPAYQNCTHQMGYIPSEERENRCSFCWEGIEPEEPSIFHQNCRYTWHYICWQSAMQALEENLRSREVSGDLLCPQCRMRVLWCPFVPYTPTYRFGAGPLLMDSNAGHVLDFQLRHNGQLELSLSSYQEVSSLSQNQLHMPHFSVLQNAVDTLRPSSLSHNFIYVFLSNGPLNSSQTTVDIFLLTASEYNILRRGWTWVTYTALFLANNPLDDVAAITQAAHLNRITNCTMYIDNLMYGRSVMPAPATQCNPAWLFDFQAGHNGQLRLTQLTVAELQTSRYADIDSCAALRLGLARASSTQHRNYEILGLCNFPSAPETTMLFFLPHGQAALVMDEWAERSAQPTHDPELALVDPWEWIVSCAAENI